MLPVRLDTVHHPNGHFVDPADTKFWRAGLPVEPLIHEAVKLDKPIFVHFINCNNDARTKAFLRRFWNDASVEIEALQSQMKTLRRLSTMCLAAGRDDESIDDYHINGYLRGAALDPDTHVVVRRIDGQARVVLSTSSTWQFMLYEIAAAIEASASIGHCEGCGDYFLFGPNTGRRNTARFCEDRCRQKAGRDRRKASAQ